MAFYVVDENNNRVEGASYEEIVALLNKAINDGTLENIVKDSAFVSKLKCCVSGQTNSIAFVTQAKYNELAANDEIIPNCYYYVIDDTTCEDIDKALVDLNKTVSTLEQKVKKIEGGLTTNYVINSSNGFAEYKNILVIPADVNVKVKLSITGSTSNEKEIEVAAPSMFNIFISNTNGISQKVVAVKLGGSFKDGVVGEEIARASLITQDNTTAKVTLTSSSPFRVVEF